MSKQILMSVLMMCLLFTGCSSKPKKVEHAPEETTVAVKQQEVKKMKLTFSPFLSEDKIAELKDIFARNLTDEDKEEIQQKLKKFKGVFNSDSDFDIKNNFDEDSMILLLLLQISHDNPSLQKELSNFVDQLIKDSMKLKLQELQNKQLKEHSQESLSKEQKKQLEKKFK